MNIKYLIDLTKCEFEQISRYEYNLIYENKIYHFTPADDNNQRGLTFLLDRSYNIITMSQEYTTPMIQTLIGNDVKSRTKAVGHLHRELLKAKKVTSSDLYTI